MPEGMLEKQLSGIWRNQWLDGHNLNTQAGESVEVVYPGRPNHGRGPDYCDATLTLSGRRVTGDIELHVCSSHWTAHGHHLDPACNRVVLHVVMWHDTSRPTVLQNGCEVPILAICGHVRAPADAWWPDAVRLPNGTAIPCHGVAQRLSEQAIATLLDSAGDSRFLSKADKFREQLERTNAAQVLFESMMTALGYAKNKEPFLELSRRLPVRVLESLVASLGDMPEQQMRHHISSLMISVAGLADAGRNAIPAFQRNTEMESVRVAGYQVDVMSPHEWELFRVRPNNSPARRLAAMSCLLVRYRRVGLLRGMLDLMTDSSSTTKSGLLRTELSTAGVGPDRTDDIIVNVLLPFVLAFWTHSGLPEYGADALSSYHAHSRLPVNCVEKHMIAQLDLDRRLLNSARRQQGLIHIYSTMCAASECCTCLLGQPQARNNVKVQIIGLAGEKPVIARRSDHGRIVGA